MPLSCLFGHKWNGCKCLRCGAIRDEGHWYKLVDNLCQEECFICGHRRSISHTWNGCSCSHCNTVRDEGHRFVTLLDSCIERCSLCNKSQPVDHDWDGCICSRCAAVRDEEHEFSESDGFTSCIRCGKPSVTNSAP